MSRLRALLVLARWPNALIAALGVAVGAWWAAPDAWRTLNVACAMLAALGITACLNAANDLADVEIDRVAHPDRPLVTGALTPRAARRVAAAAAFTGLLASAAAAPGLALLTALALAAGVAYSRHSARLAAAGNVLVAIIGACPFLYGGVAAGDWRPALALAVIAAPLHFAREVAKDVADSDGDRLAGRRSVAITRGTPAARRLVLAAVAIWLGCISFLLAAAGWRLVAVAPAAALAVWAAWRVGGASPARPPVLLKLSMLLGMAALPLLR